MSLLFELYYQIHNYYNNIHELKEKIRYYLNHYTEVPKLLNEELVDKFYDNITGIMSK